MSSAEFWSSHLNKSPSKRPNSPQTKVITLAIGFSVIKVVDTFMRRYHTSNPDNKEFKVTDVLLYLPDGEVALFQALGANKAALFTMAIE